MCNQGARKQIFYRGGGHVSPLYTTYLLYIEYINIDIFHTLFVVIGSEFESLWKQLFLLAVGAKFFNSCAALAAQTFNLGVQLTW